MAISVSACWEVRSTGAATNGGAFVAGASGSDYSQTDAARSSTPNKSVTDGVTNGTATITSATAVFSAAIVGNVVYVAGGTGSVVAGWYQVVTFNSATSITVDRSTGLTAGTGVTLNIGGALDGLVTLSGPMVASNKAWVRSGTYTQTATPLFSPSAQPDAGAPRTQLLGYYQTRGDITTTANLANRPTINLATNTGLYGIRVTGSGWQISNFIVNCNLLATSIGIAAGQYGNIYNCKVLNFTFFGIAIAATPAIIEWCEVTGGTSAATSGAINTSAGTLVSECNVHDNACPGIVFAAGNSPSQARNCLITNNTGASSDGIQVTQFVGVLERNTIRGNGRNGINFTSSSNTCGIYVKNNLIASNGAYGFRFGAAGYAAAQSFDGNAYWNNTSGNRLNMDDTGTTNPVNGSTPYVNAFDVTLTVDPFVAAASGDFRLNTTAGGGAACRGYGVPRAWPGNSLTVSAPDMGAAQHLEVIGGLMLQHDLTGGCGG